MVFFNYSTMQMAAKVVYYGPGLCGKTTNLQWIFEHTSTDSRGEMVSLATETDRTLFFDLLPIDVGSIAGFSTRIQLYTVPGQVFYNTTRKLVLKGVDGVVFVADSQRPMLQANVESFQNLEENLAEMGLSLDNIPVVLQYNKRDLPGICSVEELEQALNRQDWAAVEASAINGDGVFETLKMISKATLLALKKRLTKGRPESGGARRPTMPVTRPPTGPVRPPAAKKPAAEASPPPAPPSPAPPSPVPSPPAAIGAGEPDVKIDLEPPTLETAGPAADQPEAAAEPPAQPAAAEPPAQPAAAAPPPERPEPPAVAEAPPDLEPPGVSEPEPPAVAVKPTPPEPTVPEPTVPEPAVASGPPSAGAKPAAPAPAARRKPRQKAGGFDALQELEKLRRQTVRPRAAAENGKREINRSVRLTLNRADFSRAHRVSLTLKVEDADLRIVDEARQFHVDLDKADSLEELLLRLNIALNASA